ncbi:16S rRNA (adenine(1518)-N(6)/adenine(1519)-N(6))-dimethyltransferase RsmA [Mesomycoplasma neurolyticum]|uniref:Ribosomal RNA small subunit methyltransferase A n=1 Tax=Mesomycoplasma neurolyticum TaxID=2120 RepID=A0A449A5Q1_9BACT|nr:16S rRNA (adenine(1518)-N(6)/adenine(1519)-N(6))-dimethyltransferase RsmA [Mesomycoplasma neurolyticum]VEU59554.1 ribosomal RNA small subunit methyltransferase A [Mesomycoplasma neurolyticum]
MIDKTIKTKKHLGQNFLTNKKIVKKIIEVSNVNNKEIIEIGPGQGALTFELVKYAKKVYAYEVDEKMIEILQSNINNENLILEHQDFLKVTFDWEGKRDVVANLPYYITSNILFKIFENIEYFSKLTIMVQNEVADRIIAKPKTSEYSKLSVSCQFLANVKKEFIVKANNFFPVPKVDSAIITLEFKKDLNKKNTQDFLLFIKKCFLMKRKTLFNNLKTFLQTDSILKMFEELNIKNNVRAQELSVDKYLEIFNYLNHL